MGIFSVKLECIEDAKPLSKPLAYAAVCMKMHFKITISALEYFYIVSEAKNLNFQSQIFGLENIF